MPKLFLLGLLSLCTSAIAGPYPLGTMTCADIGKFASEAMSWRKDGQTRDQAFAALEKRTYNAPDEQKNPDTILHLAFAPDGRN